MGIILEATAENPYLPYMVGASVFITLMIAGAFPVFGSLSRHNPVRAREDRGASDEPCRSRIEPTLPKCLFHQFK